MPIQRPRPNLSESPAAAWDAAIRAGDFPAAWAISDAVLAGRDPATRDDPALPYHLRWVWDGRPFDGRRVLVRCYHGLGDTLMFARFLPALRARAAHVTLEVQSELAAVLADSADVGQVFHQDAPLPPAEVDVEIMELAHALRCQPSGRPYLRSPASPDGTGRIGVCWKAGPWDPPRSIPAAMLQAVLAPLARVAPLVSLQRGPAAADAPDLADPLDGSMDLVRTAALVAGLDAVVAVDTMVAHLAGALGRPVFVMLKPEADWRWGLEPFSVWYCSVRLVRQRTAGDWAGVAADAARALTAGLGGNFDCA